MNIRKTNEDIVTQSLPVLYRLIGPNDEFGGLFHSAVAAAEVAKITWPDQEQDPDRTGKGWDIQTVGADR